MLFLRLLREQIKINRVKFDHDLSTTLHVPAVWRIVMDENRVHDTEYIIFLAQHCSSPNILRIIHIICSVKVHTRMTRRDFTTLGHARYSTVCIQLYNNMLFYSLK